MFIRIDIQDSMVLLIYLLFWFPGIDQLKGAVVKVILSRECKYEY